MNTHFEPYPHHVRSVFEDIDRGLVHRAAVMDDGQPTTFRWHVQKGLLRPRMSALELCEFILPTMAGILSSGLLRDYPRIESEFRQMYLVLLGIPPAKSQTLDRAEASRRECIRRLLYPTEKYGYYQEMAVLPDSAMMEELNKHRQNMLDKLMSWIKVEIGTGPDDIIYMNMHDTKPQESGPIYSIPKPVGC